MRQGAAIRLRDIASVEDTFRRVTRVSRINGTPGIRLAVYKQSGKNTVKIVEEIMKEMERLQEDYPPDPVHPHP